MNSCLKSLSLIAVPEDESVLDSHLIEVPIFPLPNVVFFPNTLLPLLIFEPRYRLMVREAIAENGPVGIILMKGQRDLPPEAESDIFEIGGLGRIAEHREVEEGNYEILLSGKSRYKIIDIRRTTPYRIAQVRVLADPIPDQGSRDELANKLITAFLELRTQERVRSELQVLRQLDFPTLVNSICSSIQIGDYTKQRLLELDHLQSRAEKALQILLELRQRYEMVSDFEHLKPDDPRLN